MRKLLFAAFVLSTGVAAGQDAGPKAVVEKAVAAHGGAAALTKYPASTAKFKGQMTVLGTDVDFTGDAANQTPDKFRVAIEADVGGVKQKFVMVVNGDKVRSVQNDAAGPVTPEIKAEAQQLLLVQQISTLAPLLTDKFTLAAAKDEKVGDADAAVVVVTGGGLKEVKLYFDKKSGLLVKTSRKGLAPDQTTPVTEESVMTDFKEVSGVKQPHVVTVTHDGKKFMTSTMTEIKMLDKQDPALFDADDKPADGKDAPKPADKKPEKKEDKK